MKEQILTISQLVVAVILMGAILLQAKGTGLGRAWGGSGQFYATRRGLEKVLFRLTLVLVGVFVVLSIARLI